MFASLLSILLLTQAVVPVVMAQAAAQGTSQSNFQNITSYRVSGTLNFSNPGAEVFWKSIPWTNASMAASVAPGGGHTKFVLVKSANDGFNVFMLFTWKDALGPSYLGATEVYKAANGSLIPLSPATTGATNQLYYNSTYYYPDRAAMLWFVGSGSTLQASPVMELGTNGALTGGAADIWHWQSNPTDNNKSDSLFPGGYTDYAGKPIYPPDNLSFAEDDYTNTTGFYVTPGNFGTAPNLAPYSSPYVVLAGTHYSYANKTWTVEMVRAFTTDAPKYQVQLVRGSAYYVAFAVWLGRAGESSNFKSVSQWYTLTVSSQTPPQSAAAQSSQAGVSPLLAASVAAGVLLVGLVIGSMLRSGPERPPETKT
jgi:hypothetical protein